MNRRRGVIFVMALGIIVVLTGLALAFAQTMRTEALASANIRSQAQADAVELGAEQFVLAQVDQHLGDAYTITQVQTDTIQVGPVERPTGYFWILPADLSDVQGPVCGIVDESSKYNINIRSAAYINTFLTNLCTSLNLTLPDDTPYSIYNWANNAPNPKGATSQDYSSLPEPYQFKPSGSGFETVEELLLVGQQTDLQQNIMPQLLWGNDASRNTLLLEYNQNTGLQGQGLSNASTANASGIFNYLTVYSLLPPSKTPSANAYRIINPFTASPVVLEAIGFSDSQAEAIVEAREANFLSSGNPAGYNWARTAAGVPSTSVLAHFLIGASYRYSADIVAVCSDGRAFKRVRIVVDNSIQNPLGPSLGNGMTAPAVIIYRKDLTAYGWPLPGTQKQFQELAARGQLQLGWLGTALTSPGAMGQGPSQSQSH